MISFGNSFLLFVCLFVKDYILTLSVLCRGTLEEKLRWIFRLYDINGEGQLTREVLHFKG